MLTILVTGRIGVGKTSFMQAFEGQDVGFFYSDKTVRACFQPQSPCYQVLKQHFGLDFILENQEFDRKKLAKKVFSDKKSLDFLTSQIHPYVEKAWQDLLKTTPYSLVFYEAPLIPLLDISRFSYVILISASDDISKQRLCEQGFSLDEVQERLNHQKDDKFLKDKARFSVINLGNKKDLQKKALDILKILKTKEDKCL